MKFSAICALVVIFFVGLQSQGVAQSSAMLSRRINGQEGVGVNFIVTPASGWHVYWRYPGDSGATLKTNWACDGASPLDQAAKTSLLAPSAWPIPEVLPNGQFANYGYSRRVSLPFQLGCDRLNTKSVTVDAEWLVCREECIPQFATLSLAVNASDEETPIDNQSYPQTAQLKTEATRAGELFLIDIPESITEVTDLRFIPDSGGQIINGAPQDLQEHTLRVKRGERALSELSGLLVGNKKGINGSSKIAYPIVATIKAEAFSNINLTMNSADSSILTILLGAFLGGILLNVMPCVFPVLGLKIYQLLSTTPKQRRISSILYTCGVCISMLLLGGGIGALRASGLSVGWGTQLQNPVVVYCLIILFVLLGCNLLGLFEIGTKVQTAAGRIKIGGPLIDGLLTVLVATPCTAPFMAGAVAVAFTLPVTQQLLIFLALGLGVAAPVLAVGVVPVFARIFPKPGAWMERVKQFLAWPLFASAAWLFSVLIALVGINHVSAPLFGVVTVTFFVWLFTIMRPKRVKKLIFIVFSIGVVTWFYPNTKTPNYMLELKHVAYSPQELKRLRDAGTPVFLDATAAWCITCQSNKKLVLHTNTITQALAAKNAVWMEADWTEPNEEITKLLGEFGRAGVPLNVYFGPHKEPTIFSPILTTSMVLEALKQ